jgi:hypothetical protein
MAKATRTRNSEATPLRFAHPFFTSAPPNRRTPTPFGQRLLDYIQGTLHPIPSVQRNSLMVLADIVGASGAAAIEATGTLRFHAVGDTGKSADSPQGEVAAAMATDYVIDKPAESPAVFLHLGDVIYGPGKDSHYRQEFYEPYMHYPGKIIAIPGNHDGETIPQSDPATLRAFLANFCAATATIPPIAGSIFRQTMTQPGVYWLLDAPFVQIVGLYSNSAENPGFISGAIPGQAQKTWLVARLTDIAASRKAGTRKALIFATHHPPFSAGGHSGSTEMLVDIDDACTRTGIMPDLFLAAHSHTYQRYTRRLTIGGHQLSIPFIVAGIGGYAAQPIPQATGQVSGDHTFEYSRQGYGYLLIDVNQTQLLVKAIGVTGTQKTEFDRTTVTI